MKWKLTISGKQSEGRHELMRSLISWEGGNLSTEEWNCKLFWIRLGQIFKFYFKEASRVKPDTEQLRKRWEIIPNWAAVTYMSGRSNLHGAPAWFWSILPSPYVTSSGPPTLRKGRRVQKLLGSFFQWAILWSNPPYLPCPNQNCKV